MTNRETNYLEMAKTVLAVLKKHASKFAGKAALANLPADLEAGITAIKERNLAFGTATKGKTSAKNNAEENLIEALLPLKGGLLAYASKINNHELREIAIVSENELRRARKSEMVEKATAIMKAAGANSTALAEFGVDANLLTALQTQIQNYEATSEEKGISSTNKSALRKALTNDFDYLESLIDEQGDNLIELVRNNHPDVYNEYFAARVVKDLGGAHIPGEEDNSETPTENPEQNPE